MTASTAPLDQHELLGVALEASRRGDHATALGHLKAGAGRFPDDARIAYLLGAEHAQIGLYDRAEAEMGRALALDPGLATARFQLGLLQLTQARVDAARATWLPLDELAAGHALRLFKQGLEALTENRFAEARALVEQGMAANGFSPELNADMVRLLARLPDEAVAPSAQPAEAVPLYFGAYRDAGEAS